MPTWKVEKIVKHQTRTFSSIKEKKKKKPTNLNHILSYMWKTKHISTFTNKITVWEKQHVYMHTRESCTHFQLRHSSRFCFFILESLSAYTIGGAGEELIKSNIRQEQIQEINLGFWNVHALRLQKTSLWIINHMLECYKCQTSITVLSF